MQRYIHNFTADVQIGALQDGIILFQAQIPDVASAEASMLSRSYRALSRTLAASLLGSWQTTSMLARTCCDILKRCITHGATGTSRVPVKSNQSIPRNHLAELLICTCESWTRWIARDINCTPDVCDRLFARLQANYGGKKLRF